MTNERSRRPVNGYDAMVAVGAAISSIGLLLLFMPGLEPFAVLVVVCGVAFMLVARSENSRERERDHDGGE